MRKFLLSTISLAALGVTSVLAADLPVRPAYKSPAIVAPAFSWTGFYVGLNVGYGWGSGDGTLIDPAGAGGTFSGDGNGILGGGQIGYNWQSGPFVFGIEADIQANGADGGVNGTAGTSTVVATGSNPWFGTIRGRLGYAWDRTMVYFTGGGAYGQAELDGTITTGPAAGTTFSTSETYWSWTVGGGVEHMFMPKWSVKLEYLYFGTPDRVPVPPGFTVPDGSGDFHVVRGGINYHF